MLNRVLFLLVLFPILSVSTPIYFKLKPTELTVNGTRLNLPNIVDRTHSINDLVCDPVAKWYNNIGNTKFALTNCMDEFDVLYTGNIILCDEKSNCVVIVNNNSTITKPDHSSMYERLSDSLKFPIRMALLFYLLFYLV